MDKDQAVNVRYIVKDVSKAISFYKDFLGFKVEMHPAPAFAILSLNNLRLLLSQPGAGGGGQAMPDGQLPEPGGWNRIQIPVDDLKSFYSQLKEKGASFKNEIIQGI